MARKRRGPTTKEECRGKLRALWPAIKDLGRLVKLGRLKPRELYDALDGVIGYLAEVQMTLETRSRIKPHAKRTERDIRPDLWWPRYWKMVRELEVKGIDPKSAEAGLHLESLADDIFN